MGNTTISDTMLASNLQQNVALRQRIEAVVRAKLWSLPNANPTIPLPLDDLAWAVGSNDDVRHAIRSVMDNDQNANINRNIDAISDTLLETVVAEAMTRLSIGTEPSE